MTLNQALGIVDIVLILVAILIALRIRWYRREIRRLTARPRPPATGATIRLDPADAIRPPPARRRRR